MVCVVESICSKSRNSTSAYYCRPFRWLVTSFNLMKNATCLSPSFDDRFHIKQPLVARSQDLTWSVFSIDLDAWKLPFLFIQLLVPEEADVWLSTIFMLIFPS
jgi:hypothetical protein